MGLVTPVVLSKHPPVEVRKDILIGWIVNTVDPTFLLHHALSPNLLENLFEALEIEIINIPLSCEYKMRGNTTL